LAGLWLVGEIGLRYAPTGRVAQGSIGSPPAGASLVDVSGVGGCRLVLWSDERMRGGSVGEQAAAAGISGATTVHAFPAGADSQRWLVRRSQTTFGAPVGQLLGTR